MGRFCSSWPEHPHDWPGCTLIFFPPCLSSCWNRRRACVSALSRLLSRKKSVKVWQNEVISRFNQCHNRSPPFLGDMMKRSSPLMQNGLHWILSLRLCPPPSPFEKTHLVYRSKCGGAMSMIFSWVCILDFSDAFTAFTRSFSFACLNMKPSSLGGLIEKAGSSNSSSKNLEIAFDSSVDKPIVMIE